MKKIKERRKDRGNKGRKLCEIAFVCCYFMLV